MRWVGIDLHIHTVLSPCGDWNMSPKKIIEKAQKVGLEVIGITDHHIVENFPAVSFWGKKAEVVVLPGMEIQTKEEVHVLAIFRDYERAVIFQEIIWRYLPEEKNNEELLGIQVVVNEKEEVERIEDKLLLTSINLSLKEVIRLIKELDGIVILAHIDKPAFSVISNLGFIPENLEFDFIELSRNINLKKFFSNNPRLLSKRNKNIIISSDAHYIDDIKEPMTFLKIESKTIEGVFLGLENRFVKLKEMEV
ncbi:MAG: PHP domain-containing protein [Dictyoglomus sp.]